MYTTADIEDFSARNAEIKDPDLMEDLTQAAAKIATLMKLLTTTGGLRLKYRITAGAGAADPDGLERRDLYVECKGPDADLLLDRDAELLRALEHVTAKILRLEPEEHDRVSFDTDGYKADRAAALRDQADDAIDVVDDTGQPFRFPPMNSRERRMLHMFLKDSGLQTASTGEGPTRSVVLYPEGYEIPPERPRFSDRARRNSRGPSRNGPRSGGRSRY
jgi:spoIIIJ-associated protein